MNRVLTLLLSAFILGLLLICAVSGLPVCQQTSSFIAQTSSSLPITGVLITLPVLVVYLLVKQVNRVYSFETTHYLSLTRLLFTPVYNGITMQSPHLLNRVFLL